MGSVRNLESWISQRHNGGTFSSTERAPVSGTVIDIMLNILWVRWPISATRVIFLSRDPEFESRDVELRRVGIPTFKLRIPTFKVAIPTQFSRSGSDFVTRDAESRSLPFKVGIPSL